MLGLKTVWGVQPLQNRLFSECEFFCEFSAAFSDKLWSKSLYFCGFRLIPTIRTCILLFVWFRVLIFHLKYYSRVLVVENGNYFSFFHFMLNETFLYASLSASSFSLLVFISNHYFVSSRGIRKTVLFCLLSTFCPLTKKLAKSILSILSHEAI